jgi:hypothetical protein
MKKSNTSYYTIEVTVDPADIEKINQLKGRTSALKPGPARTGAGQGEEAHFDGISAGTLPSGPVAQRA